MWAWYWPMAAKPTISIRANTKERSGWWLSSLKSPKRSQMAACKEAQSSSSSVSASSTTQRIDCLRRKPSIASSPFPPFRVAGWAA